MTTYTAKEISKAIAQAKEGEDRWLLQAMLIQIRGQAVTAARLAKVTKVSTTLARWRIRLLVEKGLLETDPEECDCSDLENLRKAFATADDARLNGLADATVDELRDLGLLEGCSEHSDHVRIPDDRIQDVLDYLGVDSATKRQMFERWERERDDDTRNRN